ncbi:AAL177Wp [Eremothecium gossypii ATCC 10895]|uniref:AAL177Wp n=1 Tax=Eremothecium gossypii (strain ATCC 10895 / CBS 109.51 / FGSC 9923 / NRRL Y-1056) TaxID=284811 RepID=Q75FA8_EREGS|nr:AAL177Wp [Eremothecium gossypii ATCC 10895]AAS50189.1 AAL177Wp [Eremothecium gossypii ATCC 10895]AEY94474.1 FAAL177Wp [Eremothecium gossypii FDAG1]
MESQAAVEEPQHSVVIETPPTTAESSETPVADTATGAEPEGAGGAAVVAPKRMPTRADFPPLSSVIFETQKVQWGPNMKKPESQSASPSPSPGPVGSGAKPMRSKTMQEAFSLDLQTQVTISKAEFSKFVVSVKQSHSVSIESTLSKLSRTFLITGSPTNVYNAKRELVKKLTRPVTVVIQVPSKTVSSIIGPGGRMIREITNAAGGIKIDIAKTAEADAYDADLDDQLINISLHGDVASVNFAKDKILSIVKEETKNATISVAVENKQLIPFISLADVEISEDVTVKAFPNGSEKIVLMGPRDEAKEAKVNVQNYLNTLASKVSEKKISIPRKFQPLIDAEDVREKYKVSVIFPTALGDDTVSFYGLSANLDDAIAYARQSSKQYIVESLEVSKAHGKNVAHAKNLMFYFAKYDILKDIKESFKEVKLVLPTPEELPGLDNVSINIISKADIAEQTKTVRKQIINIVNRLTPSHVLAVDDLDYELFHKDIKQALSKAEIPFVQLGDHYEGDNTVLLFAKVDEEDFQPSPEEVKEHLEKVAAVLDEVRTKQSKLFTKIVNFDAEFQVLHFSDDSVTWNLVLENITSAGGHAQIKLHTPSEDEITIRGDEKAVKAAVKAFESIAENPSKKSKLTVSVPANTVSRLIGPKGTNLAQIRQKFDVQIDVPSESNDTNTEITLTGLEYNLQHAKTHIASEAKKWADITTKELIVPTKYHGSLIGSQGTYRIRLENKYSVRIQFPKEGEVVTIKGPSRGVNKAHAELKALLDFEIENGHKSVINVPVEHVPRVIGKNGDVINGIRAELGVELKLLQNTKTAKEQNLDTVQLEITGSRQAIKEASKAVDAIIAEASDFTTKQLEIDAKYHKLIVGPGGSTLKDFISKAGGDDIRNKTVDVPNAESTNKVITISGPKTFVEKMSKALNQIVQDIKASVAKELNIPADRQGALIGPGGSVRRQLESQFNVRIEVPDKGKEGKVTIHGRPEAVEKCEKEIFSTIIRDSYDQEIMVPAVYHAFVSERGQLINKLRMTYFINVKHGNSSKKANKLSRSEQPIPIERVRGSEGEGTKLTIEEVSAPEASANDNIPWRLTYEHVDLSDILGEEGKHAMTKEQALEAAADQIKERIELAPKANCIGYLWCENVKKFNKVVGPGGSNIKQIRETTNTLINVPKKSDKVSDIIYVRGTKESVEKACKMICDALNK